MIAERVIKILILEDVAADAELIERSLRRGSVEFVSQRVDTRVAFVEALDAFKPDIVLCDFSLPSFDALSAIEIVREREPQLPVVLVSGVLSDDAAVQVARAGAEDYVLKDRLARLPSVVENAVTSYEDARAWRRAQAALRAAEARYRGLFESAQDGLILADAETGNVVDVNPFMVDLLGYSHEDYFGKFLWDIPALRNLVADEVAFRALKIEGCISREDVRVVAKDGTYREVDFLANRYLAARQNLFQCTIRDVTQRRRVARNLRRSQAEYRSSELRYRRLFESSGDGILILDAATGSVAEVNPALTALLGRPAQNYLGVPPWKLAWLMPIAANEGTFAEMRVKGFACVDNIALEGSNGEKLQVQFESRVYGSGEREVVQWRLHDITGQKLAEQKIHEDEVLFRSVVEQKLAGIYILRMDGKIAYLNAGFAELAGYDVESVIGKSFTAFLPETEKAHTLEAFQGHVTGMRGTRAVLESTLLRKDGSTRSVLFSSTLASFEGEPAIIGLMLDITDRKVAERQRREDDARFHALVDQQFTGVFMLHTDGTFTYANPGLCAILGREQEEILGRIVLEFVTDDARPEASKKVQRELLADSAPVDFQTKIVRKSGEVRDIHVTSTMATVQGSPTVIGTVIDVTDRVEGARIRERLATIVNTVEDSIVSTDEAGTIVTWNGGAEQTYGYSAEEAIGKDVRMLLRAEGVPAINEMYAKMIAGNDRGIFRSEVTCVKKGGSTIDVALSVVPLKDENGKVTGTAGVSRDVTDRNATERKLQSSEKQFRELVEQAPEAIAIYDADTQRFILANHTALDLFECSSEQLLSGGTKQFYSREQPDGQDTNVTYADHDRRALSGENVTFERRICVSSGAEKTCEVRLSRLPSASGRLLRASFIEITERKRVEKRIARVTRALKSLSAANEAVVHAIDEVELLHKLCDLLVDVGGYSLAWVGAAEPDDIKNIRVLAHAGLDDGYLESTRIAWGDSNRDDGPSHRAMRTGEMQVDPKYGDAATRPWRKEARERGFLAAIALPLKVGSAPFPVLTIYAGDADAFDAEELGLLAELMNDLAFGIIGIRNSEERTTAVRRLQENLESTVRAIASTLELRDPYTAGHQRRVGMLAATIARELGFSEERAHAVYLAGVVHDIGKITVPAEILSKPGKLTSTEFDLIRVHAQAGYGILKDISFPWPLPEMVRQHHERLDGSGYPRGLKANEILAEAKILAVADVMEAMLAHRPYRPSRGVAAALEELERGKGTIYDTAAVDVCLSLFREKGFAFDYELDRTSVGI